MPVAAPAPPAPSAAALVPAWIGSRAYEADGTLIGHVIDVLFEEHSSAPGWLLVSLLRPEDRFVLAPAQGLRHRLDGVQLACDRELVRTAPTADAPPDALTARHVAVLARHYGVRRGAGPWCGVVEPVLVGPGRRTLAGRFG